MGSTTSQYKEQLEQAKQTVPVGARYRHFKSPEKTYTVIGHGFIEATEEPAIIYQAEYGDRSVWIRPVDVFLQDVEWDGARVARFTRIDPE